MIQIIAQHELGSYKVNDSIIPDAGPLDVMDCLNQMWREQEVTVEKYTKYNSKRRIKQSLGQGGPSKEAISTSKDWWLFP